MESYDWIIVGAGSAGCVLAHRLAGDAGARVLLLEAGGEADLPLVAVPGAASALENTRLDWGYRTQPQARLNGRRVDWARGRGLGGSSAINWCLYVRGNRGDYDGWAQKGCTGWDYDSVLPYFRRAEANATFRDAWHGTDGPLSVEDSPSRGPLHEVYLEACQSIGIPFNPDPNGAVQEGCTVNQSTLRGGRRCSAAVAYLEPVRGLPNLTVVTGALVTGLWVEGTRVRGVDWLEGGRTPRRAGAGEVILAAGAIASPHVLMLSGIGPAEHLREHGIPVVADLPGVGANLLDHFGRVLVSVEVRDPERWGFRAASFEAHLAEWRETGGGALSSMQIDAGAFVRLREGDEYPSAQLAMSPGFGPRMEAAGGRCLLHFGGYVCRTLSEGTVRLASGDPMDRPLIDPDYLADPQDLELTVALVEKNLEIAQATPFAPVRGGFVHDLSSREKIVAHVRATGTTSWHPTSTCRMGVDERAVVDPALRVRGVEGLRVADASIMPAMVSGNTNAPVIMIAEKAADLVRSG